MEKSSTTFDREMNPQLPRYACHVNTMTQAKIIDGRALAEKVKQDVRRRADALCEKWGGGRRPRLDALLVGGEGGAKLYAKNQAAMCRELGIEHELHKLPADANESQIAEYINRLNDDPGVQAIMMHLPLPEGVNTEYIQSLITPEKDVEGVNPANIGNVVYGRRSLVPCTALAVMEAIESTGVKLPGAMCVCVGASNIVGKPVVVLLMSAEATVVSTNIHTNEIEKLTKQADVLVSATGVPGLVKKAWVKPGAVVIDVGIKRMRGADGKMHTFGDVAFEEVAEVAGYISPVPGGVGPVTVAMLMRNVVDAAEHAEK